MSAHVASAKRRTPASNVGCRSSFRWELNPSQGCEKIVCELIKETGEFIAVPYGVSGTREDLPHLTKEEYADFMSSTRVYGKRPDVLVLKKADRIKAKRILNSKGSSLERLHLTADKDIPSEFFALIVSSIEVEFSSHFAIARCDTPAESDIPRLKNVGYASPSYSGKKAKRHHKKYAGIGHVKSSKIPNLIVKQQDCQELQEWCDYSGVPLLFAVFMLDCSFLLQFDDVKRGIKDKVFKSEERRYSKSEIHPVHYVWYSIGIELADQVKPLDYRTDSSLPASGSKLDARVQYLVGTDGWTLKRHKDKVVAMLNSSFGKITDKKNKEHSALNTIQDSPKWLGSVPGPCRDAKICLVNPNTGVNITVDVQRDQSTFLFEGTPYLISLV